MSGGAAHPPIPPGPVRPPSSSDEAAEERDHDTRQQPGAWVPLRREASSLRAHGKRWASPASTRSGASWLSSKARRTSCPMSRAREPPTRRPVRSLPGGIPPWRTTRAPDRPPGHRVRGAADGRWASGPAPPGGPGRVDAERRRGRRGQPSSPADGQTGRRADGHRRPATARAARESLVSADRWPCRRRGAPDRGGSRQGPSASGRSAAGTGTPRAARRGPRVPPACRRPRALPTGR